MKRTKTLIVALAAAVLSIFAAPGAFASQRGTHHESHSGTINGQPVTVTCDTWDSLVPPAVGMYPADDSHFWVCFSGADFIASRADTIRLTTQSSPWTARSPNSVNDSLKNHNVTYYYFRNRDESNLFMNGKYVLTVGTTTSTTARCGNTGTTTVVVNVVTEIFENCTYASSSQQNPDLAKTTSHESGHAFSAGLARDYGSQGPDRSTAWKALATSDLVALTPSDWTNTTKWTPQAKANYICNMFGQNLQPSQLELSLDTPAGSVCPSGNPATVNSPYNTMSPSQIAQARIPYFTTGTGYIELWAEIFSDIVGGGLSSGPLQSTDRIITTGSSPVQDYNCARLVTMNQFVETLAPPVNGLLLSRGCPDHPQSDFKTP